MRGVTFARSIFCKEYLPFVFSQRKSKRENITFSATFFPATFPVHLSSHSTVSVYCITTNFGGTLEIWLELNSALDDLTHFEAQTSIASRGWQQIDNINRTHICLLIREEQIYRKRQSILTSNPL